MLKPATAEIYELTPVENLRRTARIMGPHSASAKTLAQYDASIAEGKTPVIVSFGEAVVVFHDQPLEAALGRIAIVRSRDGLEVIAPSRLLELAA